MKKQKPYIRLTLVISILFGIILPVALGLKDPTLITITFSMVWFLYAVILFVIVSLFRPGLRIKTSRQNGVTVVRYELLNPTRKEGGETD